LILVHPCKPSLKLETAAEAAYYDYSDYDDEPPAAVLFAASMIKTTH